MKSRHHPLRHALRGAVIGGAALWTLLAAPPASADPSASCCFTGYTTTCLDGPGRNLVCDLIDPYCCDTAWDSICVQEYQDWVGYTCPPLFRGYRGYGGWANTIISAFGEDVCDGVDPDEHQWSVFFNTPANPIVGSSTMVAFEARIDELGGGGGDGATLEIFSNYNGVLRGGLLETTWFGDLLNACDEPIEGVLFEVGPRTTKSCYSQSAAPRCQSASVEACVCHGDPFCCSTAWDSLCVAQAHDCPDYMF